MVTHSDAAGRAAGARALHLTRQGQPRRAADEPRGAGGAAVALAAAARSSWSTLIVGLALATALWSGVQAINAEARASYDRAAAPCAGGDACRRWSRRRRRRSAGELRRRCAAPAGWSRPVVEGALRTGRGPRAPDRRRPAAPPPPRRPAGAGRGRGRPELLHPAAGAALCRRRHGRAARGAPALPPLVVDAGPRAGHRRSPTSAWRSACWRRRAASAGCCCCPTSRWAGRPWPRSRRTSSLRAPEAAGRLGAADRQLPPEPDRLRAAVLRGRPLHRPRRHRPRLRAAPRRCSARCARWACRARTLVALLAVELLVLAAGRRRAIGMALGWLIAAALLPDVAATLRGLYGAAVEGTLTLRPAWWAAGLGDRARRHGAGGRRGALEGGASAAAGARAAARLGAGVRARAGRAGRRRRWRCWRRRRCWRLRRRAGRRASRCWARCCWRRRWCCRSGWPARWRWAPGRRAGPVAQWFWADTRQQLPGPLAGADGAAAGAGRQHRRRHDGLVASG